MTYLEKAMAIELGTGSGYTMDEISREFCPHDYFEICDIPCKNIPQLISIPRVLCMTCWAREYRDERIK